MSVQPASSTPSRPADVDTGFWLWLAALPLLIIGQIVDIYFTATTTGASMAVGVLSTAFALAVGAVVLTLLLLMRSGYRWTRTMLTGGGLATIFYTLASLITVVRPTVSAVVFAVTGIVGSVLIGGGVYLLHRTDSHKFFTR
ncbi:hypothetical protein [Mycolicibacterium sp.]|uniref:hypothetical protein n=1 Tax=Mycolicibacterium sp. TaxID=2320850 RepID=UPI0025F7BEFD|nr:hypothetical protein [Mycolicibacterium sp.]